jgi:squamous cell carcinoma antigen recognized by T-cells 3
MSQYIAVLRKGKLKERLKAARRAMQERFPLTEQLWTEWLDDEVSGSSAAEMTQLHEMSVGDYLSVPLWRRHLE